MAGIDVSFCWALGEVDPVDGLTFLKDCGFEGIELWPNTLDLYGAASWSKALTKTGMRAFQLCPYFNFVDGDEALVASRAEFNKYFSAAKMMNCHRLRVFTGTPWGNCAIGAKDATPKQWSDAIEGLQEYCDVAMPEGVELCLRMP